MISLPLPVDPSTNDSFASGAPFAVLFDSDGVVVDSEQISLVAFRQATEEFIGAPLPEDEIEAACGLRDADIVARMARRFGVAVDIEAYKDRKASLYRYYAEEKSVHAFAGVRELLDHLSEQRIPYALASSGPRWKIEYNLAAANLRHLFPVAVSGEEVERGKPEPDVFIEAARRVGMDPRRCVVIEDSVNGVRAARAAGMACMAVTNTFAPFQLHQADRIVESLERITADDLGRLVFDKNLRRAMPSDAALAAPLAVKTRVKVLN